MQKKIYFHALTSSQKKTVELENKLKKPQPKYTSSKLKQIQTKKDEST